MPSQLNDLGNKVTISVAIISDTHGYLDPRIQQLIQQCDYAIHAGDICGEDILEAMHPKHKVIAVAGNNEPRCMAHVPLQSVGELTLPSGTICIEHGHEHGHHTPSHASLRAKHPHARLVIYGHTHKLIQDKSALPWVINPGAAGRTRTHGGPSCLVLSANDQCWHIEEFRFTD